MRLVLAAAAVGLVGFLLGTVVDALRSQPGWDVVGASIGLNIGVLAEARRLHLLGADSAAPPVD